MSLSRSAGPLRLAILVDDDRVWHLPCWIKTLPHVVKEHTVVGIWQFEHRLGKRTGKETRKWYLDTFGIGACTILDAYSLRRQLANLWCGTRTLEALARKHSIPFHQAGSPNGPSVGAWMRAQVVDVCLIMLNNILKGCFVGTNCSR